jgi:hypothetical protein
MGAFVPFTNPVIGGEDVLIRTAIRSPDYVAGMTGWSINRDGSAEFNNVTVRGSFISGPVSINSGGISVLGTTSEYEINVTGGFIARNVPDNSAEARLVTFSQSPPFTPGLVVDPKSPSALGNTLSPGFLIGHNDETLLYDQPSAQIFSPFVTAIGAPTRAIIRARSQRSTSIVDDSNIELQANRVQFTGGIYVNDYGIDVGRGRIGGAGSAGSVGPITTTELAIDITPSYTFKAGRLYTVRMNAPATMSVASNRLVSRLRKTNAAGTQIAISGHQFANTGTGNVDWEVEFYVGSTDVTTALCWSGIVANGAVACTVSAPNTMSIYDIGIAAETGADTYLFQLT